MPPPRQPEFLILGFQFSMLARSSLVVEDGPELRIKN